MNNIFSKILIAVLFSTFLVGCQTTSSGRFNTTNRQVNYNMAENVILRYVGNGLCLNCFNAYRQMGKRKAFAISTGGTFAYSRNQRSTKAAMRKALGTCNAHNRKRSKPCRLLMVNDRFVWR